MDTIKNILSELQDRFRNPLLGSFILAWLVCNWQISTLLIHFFTASDAMPYENFVQEVGRLLSWKMAFCWPLVIAILYVVLFPLLKHLINYLHTRYNMMGTKWELKASKDKGISTNKYIQLREQYLQKIDEVATVIAGETTWLNEIEQLRREKAQMQTVLDTKYNQYENQYLEGTWKLALDKSELKDTKWTGAWFAQMEVLKLKIAGRTGNRLTNEIHKVKISQRYINFYNRETKNAVISGTIIMYKNDEKENNRNKTEYMLNYTIQFIDNNADREEMQYYIILRLNKEANEDHLSGLLNGIPVRLIKETS